MLELICRLIDSLAVVEEGVETVLTPTAFESLRAIVEDLYGEGAAETFENLFEQRSDGSMVVTTVEVGDKTSDAFRLCVVGER